MFRQIRCGLAVDMAAKAFGYSRETWNRFENGDPIAKPVIMAISYHEQLQELRVQLAEALDVGGASLARRDAPARR